MLLFHYNIFIVYLSSRDPSRGNLLPRTYVCVCVCHHYGFFFIKSVCVYMCVCVSTHSRSEVHFSLNDDLAFISPPCPLSLPVCPPSVSLKRSPSPCVCVLMLRLCAFQESLYNCSVRLSRREAGLKRGCVKTNLGHVHVKRLVVLLPLSPTLI